MRVEISFDLVMHERMSFAEGTFRLPDGEWQVFIFGPLVPDVDKLIIKKQIWKSGVSGVFVGFPERDNLNKETIKKVLSSIFEVAE